MDFTIRTQKDLEQAVEKYGILPLFRNAVPGFSVEDHVVPAAWFSGEEGVWEWKGPVIRNTGCAYGKFLGNKAVFISRKWFPDFANWRRDGYDFDARFDDELASYQDKTLYDLLDKEAPVLSKKLKIDGNYRKDGNKGFETVITRLQAQCYVLISDFVYSVDRNGNRYGWGVAEYSTPEKFMGKAFTDAVYQREPEESYARILRHLQRLLPEADRKTIESFLLKSSGAARPSGQKIWLVPSNYKYYNVIEAFRENEIIHWKQGNDNMRAGDLLFLYVGVPFSAILYRCEILETDIPFEGESGNVTIKKLIRIKKLEEYPEKLLNLPELKKYGVVTVRAARSMPAELARDIARGKLK